MKAITVLQPWASLILSGQKRFETRTWTTKHRGTLLIHAGRKLSPLVKELCQTTPFQDALTQLGTDNVTTLTYGALIGTVELLDCIPADTLTPTPLERQFGDFRPGRWAWQFANPSFFATPIPWRGALSLFEVPEAMLP